MALEGVVLDLALGVGVMLCSATLVLVGPARFTRALRDAGSRFRSASLSLGALLGVLALRWGGSQSAPWTSQDVMSWLQFRVVGRNITPLIDRFERELFAENPVIVLQSLESDLLTSFFVFSYLYGYAFLLLFPFVAYFSLRRMDRFNSLVLAFTANYAIGLFCYVLFIAYGPRNLLALEVVPLLYESYPQARFLTNEINQNTNVFPSLHTSLSVSVFFLALATRDEYPLWVPISGVLALSVVVSTMYLGIHWFSDVLAGVVLAAVSVYIGLNFDLEQYRRPLLAAASRQVRRRPDGG
ncbi:phosphatase PAP2 family protein [Saliphagus sp. GCM10025334]